MYWTHLIFALFGVLVFKGLSAAKPGYLDFDNLPETNFSCENKVIGGYYADVETGCQMFHVCTIGQKGEVTDIKFLCLNGTVFDQETRVCERIDEVDCSKSEDFFGLNLELYGNNGHQSNQQESEFECDECSTEEDYDETTTYGTTSTTTTTTTTPVTTTVKSTTGATKLIHFPSSSPETIAALLALHNAFTLSLQQQQQKINAPPPRLINNAFGSTTKPTQKPFYGTTQSGNINVNLNTHYATPSQGYSSVSPVQQQRPKPFYQITTPPAKSNYHHFQSGDTSFGHSFDSEKPYNFQYFHSRRIEEPTQQSSVSVVTSTSTSTSIRTSKSNSTEFPTGYDYQDGELDPFFRDVPKIRLKREEKRYPNHRYPDEKRHLNHKYDDDKDISEKLSKEEFLGNLLDSLDMEEHDRKKMLDFFLMENKNIKDNSSKSLLKKLGGTLGEVIMEDINKTIHSHDEMASIKNLELELWKNHFDEMSQEVDVDFKLGEREKRDLQQKYNYEIDLHGRKKKTRVKRQVRRGNIDTEKFASDNGRRRKMRTTTRATEIPKKLADVKPVSEEVDEGGFTTLPYRRITSKRTRTLVRTTENYAKTSKIRFNYETTTAISPRSSSYQQSVSRRRVVKPISANVTRDVTRLKEVPVYEDLENPASSDRIENRETNAQTKVPNISQKRTNRDRGRSRMYSRTTSATTANSATMTPAPTVDPNLIEDLNFSCEGKIKGGFYADIVSDCRGFFICSQGQINGPLLITHFWCGTATKFNQRSRTCQTDYLVECSLSARYYHLNNQFIVPVSEDELRGGFEPMRVKT
uniref:Putative golgin subfamily protein n=1 Tax=Panstrongylus lignarius TaxID=156445 RepID=A0A224X7D7_9HEMI